MLEARLTTRGQESLPTASWSPRTSSSFRESSLPRRTIEVPSNRTHSPSSTISWDCTLSACSRSEDREVSSSQSGFKNHTSPSSCRRVKKRSVSRRLFSTQISRSLLATEKRVPEQTSPATTRMLPVVGTVCTTASHAEFPDTGQLESRRFPLKTVRTGFTSIRRSPGSSATRTPSKSPGDKSGKPNSKNKSSRSPARRGFLRPIRTTSHRCASSRTSAIFLDSRPSIIQAPRPHERTR